MPTPVLVALAVLIAYPLIQIVAIRLRRADRLAFRALIDEMKADPAYQGKPEQDALNQIDDDAYGSPVVALTPIILPIMVIADILAPRLEEDAIPSPDRPRSIVYAFGTLRHVPASSPLWDDDRLPVALRLSVKLCFETWPVSTFLAAVLAAPFAALEAILRWVRTNTLEHLSAYKVGLRLWHVFGAFGAR
ncbi:arabinogalactan endo-1,4-beta-galactosidase [Methylorubrum populi]|uniref:Arabinogalactan endo-1,4-beta-galactosidase n=1 Tax=Methylorubrum populi TaxID=223967 RepID=A0A160PMW0_9HYPH|nr:hypothetical protein [Methylorubrum populi]BAU93380.1 arabinogalactan endo-1,4-beta-galactosidase [Methylorubrum populi]